jgi:cytidylate kinase
MKHKIAFAGIDGSGKTTCMDLLISKLQSRYNLTKVGDPCIFCKDGEKKVVRNTYYRVKGRVRPISKKYGFYNLFLIWSFICKFLVAKYLELFKKNDLIMYESDILLHAAVYITYHFPFSKIISSNLRFKIVSMLLGTKSKKNFSIFYMDTEPEVAMERIHKRAETGVDIHAHENTRDLKKLKKEFDDILEVASEKGFEIFRINTNGKSLDEVAIEVQTILEKKLSTSLQKS